MTTGEKLTQLRKENNITQEQLADYLGVSRQSISRWESDIAYPETEKIIKLSELYHVCVDYLLKDSESERVKESPACSHKNGNSIFSGNGFFNNWYYEKKSKVMVGKLPLWHINIGFGRTAKGIFAIGFKSMGIFSLGLLSLGIFSAGVLSLGLLVFACMGLGLIAFGSLVVGLVAIGAVAIGIFSVGAVAIGDFAIGAVACGKYFALGDNAYGLVAIGKTVVEGTYTATSLSEVSYEAVKQLLDERVPGIFGLFKLICEGLVQ